MSEPYTQKDGARLYQEERARRIADPEYLAIYEDEAAKKDLWLQLVEARQVAGLTLEQMAQRLGVSHAQVSRIEKRGYDACTLTSLRRYVRALGEGFTLEVKITQMGRRQEAHGVMAAP